MSELERALMVQIGLVLLVQRGEQIKPSGRPFDQDSLYRALRGAILAVEPEAFQPKRPQQ